MKLYERLPEMLAELIASAPGPEQGEQDLVKFEAALSAELFSLIEEIFDLGLTTPSRTYDPVLMGRRLEPILEVARLLDQRRQSRD